MRRPRPGRHARPSLLVALIATLLAAPPAAAAPGASVSQYGGTGGVVETIPGRTITTPTTQTPPGGQTQPNPPVTSEEVPVDDGVPVATPQDAPAPTPTADRGLLSLPDTGMTVGLLVAAGLLLTGVGLATRRLAGAPAHH